VNYTGDVSMRISDGDGRLVLIADDSQDTREVYRQFLVAAGYHVAEAGDGHEAVAQATALRPAVVVLDLGLPMVDGWVAAERIAAHPDTRSIPVVILSGHAQPEVRKRAADRGCAGFLVKPCEPQRLLEMIASVINRA
jgi:two-component system, cell cycle response regulator DivK